MNKPRKESALKKYSGLSKEDVLAALPTDEKAYTPDEQEEIIEALFSGNTTQQPAPSNPIADALKDLAYHGRIEGEQFRNYHKLADQLEMDKQYVFQVFKVRPVKKERYRGMPNSPIDVVGIEILDATPIKTTQIPAKMMRDFNGFVPDEFNGESFFTVVGGHWTNIGNNPAAFGQYFLLKKD